MDPLRAGRGVTGTLVETHLGVLRRGALRESVHDLSDTLGPAPEAAVELLRRGKRLEWFTLGWNVVGVIVLAVLAFTASSVALAGFGLDSFIDIAASTVVLWELSGTSEARQRRALRLIGVAFLLLAVYLLIQSIVALLAAHHRCGPGPEVGNGVRVSTDRLFPTRFSRRRRGRSIHLGTRGRLGRQVVRAGRRARESKDRYPRHDPVHPDEPRCRRDGERPRDGRRDIRRVVDGIDREGQRHQHNQRRAHAHDDGVPPGALHHERERHHKGDDERGVAAREGRGCLNGQERIWHQVHVRSATMDDQLDHLRRDPGEGDDTLRTRPRCAGP